MRLCCFITTLTACGISVASVVLDRDIASTAALVSVMLVSALGGKAVQKFAEVREVRTFENRPGVTQ